MAFFPDSLIDEVRDRNDIVDVVSRYVSLRQKGNRHWGLCPFHQEKTPSFSVNAAEQFFYCFGCHAGGNVFQFIQAVERCDFTESVRILAERAHMKLPEGGEKGRPNGRREHMDKLYAAGREAARFFHRQLVSRQGDSAMAYLTGRGLTPGTIRAFGLGYAPDRWDGLLTALREKGIEDGIMAEFGLVREKEGRYYDAFRNRVMFPIIDSRGRVIGFGGRVLDDSLPKYMNSPETPVFNKRRNLYGVHALRKLGTIDRIMIVEGYMDLISLHQAGFQTVVASLGTALTQEQARLLRRYCPDIIIAYDADTAGQNATLRGMRILEEAGLRVRVATLTDGKDPDDFVRRHGLAGIEDLIGQAKPLNAYHMDRIRQEFDLDSPDERVRYVSTCCREVLSRILSPVERNQFVKTLHMQTGVDENAIEEEIALGRMNIERQRKNRTGNSRNNNAEPNVAARKGLPHGMSRAVASAERALIRYTLTGKEAAARVFKTLAPDAFTDPVLGKAARLISEQWAEGRKPALAGILSHFEPEEGALLAGAVEEAGEHRDELYIAQCMDQVIIHKIKTRLDALTERISTETDDDKKSSMKKEFDELKVNYHKMKQGAHRKEGYHD
ncbi:MAG: DNA primase [Clostridiales bacterium]|nr:DNA primase [Clostridiales bacterium]